MYNLYFGSARSATKVILMIIINVRIFHSEEYQCRRHRARYQVGIVLHTRGDADTQRPSLQSQQLAGPSRMLLKPQLDTIY